MSLSDCSECWDTPCTCGNDYNDWSKKEILKQILMLIKALLKKRKGYEKNI